MNSFFQKGLAMRVNYNKLMDLLKEKNLHKSDLIKIAHVNSNAVSDISKGNMLSVNALSNICRFLLCQPSDIMEIKFDKQVQDDYYRKKLIRMLMGRNVIKIPTDDNKNVRFYLVEKDPITDSVNNGKVRFMVELASESDPAENELWIRDETGALVCANAEKIVKELEEQGFRDEYTKSDIAREALLASSKS